MNKYFYRGEEGNFLKGLKFNKLVFCDEDGKYDDSMFRRTNRVLSWQDPNQRRDSLSLLDCIIDYYNLLKKLVIYNEEDDYITTISDVIIPVFGKFIDQFKGIKYEDQDFIDIAYKYKLTLDVLDSHYIITKSRGFESLYSVAFMSTEEKFNTNIIIKDNVIDLNSTEKTYNLYDNLNKQQLFSLYVQNNLNIHYGLFSKEDNLRIDDCMILLYDAFYNNSFPTYRVFINNIDQISKFSFKYAKLTNVSEESYETFCKMINAQIYSYIIDLFSTKELLNFC